MQKNLKEFTSTGDKKLPETEEAQIDSEGQGREDWQRPQKMSKTWAGHRAFTYDTF